MIITRPKHLDEILEMLGRFRDSRICIVGCGVCARKINTGGEPQVAGLAAELREQGLEVDDAGIVKHACSVASWEELTLENNELAGAGVLIVLSCGAGVSLLGRLSGLPALPGLDTTSLGGAVGDETLEGLCSMCGQCDVGIFAGLCPKSGCPKSQVNGPCGGSDDGDCEVEGRECIWSRIYDTLADRDMLSMLDEKRPLTDHNRRL